MNTWWTAPWLLDLAPRGWFTLTVALAATVLMAFEKLGPDLVIFSAVCLLVVAGVIGPEEALSGFSRPETVTIGVLFVIAKAVQDTGALTPLTSAWLSGVRGIHGANLRLLLPTAGLSAFLNNTPIVAMLVPVASGLARRLGQAPSSLLMPVSFAAMLGGTCTLIGTSTNLVVSGLLESTGHAPIGMFELAAVGLPTLTIGLIYLFTVGRFLLRPRSTALRAAQHEAREYLAEVSVASDSPLVGQTIEDAGLRSLPGLFLVEIRRGDDTMSPVGREDILLAGDQLVFTGVASTIHDLTSFPGLFVPERDSAAGEPRSEQGMFEVVVSHHSPLVGRTPRQIEFRRRYGAGILAIHRAGERVQSKIGEVQLRPGDTLVLVARPGFRRAFQDSPDFYLVSEVSHPGSPKYRKAPFALAALGLLVTLPALLGTTMTLASMAALLLILFTGSLTPRAARDAVNWPVLLLIGSAFGISAALTTSGAATAIANAMLASTRGADPIVLLAVVYALTSVFSLFVSNAAAAALMFPIALSAAASAGLDPRPFAIALAMAASAAFATPIGYQTNMIVYGPGGYRYLDFVRVGLPLQILCLIVAVAVIPVFWPL